MTSKKLPKELYCSLPVPLVLKTPQLMYLPWFAPQFLSIKVLLERNHLSREERVRGMMEEFFHMKYGRLADRGISALYFGLTAMEEKGEIIIASFTYRKIIQIMHLLGFEPVFADIESDFNISPESIERCISKRTRAVFVTHMFGKVAKIDEIRQVIQGKNILFIENSVHAHGARYDGKPIGSFGDFSLNSFSNGKIVKVTGGGLFLTNSEALWKRIATIPLPYIPRKEIAKKYVFSLLKNRYKCYLAPIHVAIKKLKGTYGKLDLEERLNSSETVGDFSLGYSPKAINPLQLALLGMEWKKLDSFYLDRIKRNARQMSEELASVPEVVVSSEDEREHVYNYYPIVLNKGNRYDLGRYLGRMGIETQWSYFPIHYLRRYEGCRRDHLPATEDLWHRYLYLPIANPMVQPKHVSYIADCVKRYFREKS